MLVISRQRSHVLTRECIGGWDCDASSCLRICQRWPPIYLIAVGNSSTYDHRISNLALPVRSAVLKRDTGGLVVKWVTIGESPLLYVFAILLLTRIWLLSFCMQRNGSTGTARASPEHVKTHQKNRVQAQEVWNSIQRRSSLSVLHWHAQTPLMHISSHTVSYTSSTLVSGCCSKYLNSVWYKTSMVPDWTLVQTARGPTPRNQPAMPSVLYIISRPVVTDEVSSVAAL
jgi:hypothetical protein